ncbi:MAG TPA: hypothetical protein VHP33_21560 [Polyangiaceae bacterium]|nr:hypothetical protein [Polyangiaceae bacterium]
MRKTLLSRSLEHCLSIAAGTGSSLALLLNLGACSGETDTPAASGGMAGTSTSVAGASAGVPAAMAGTASGGAAGSSSSGAGGVGVGGGAGSGGGAPQPTFEGVKTMIQGSCFGGLCHDLAEHPLKLKIDDALYTTLTTYSTEHCGPLVKVGSPQESALIKLLKGPCGETERMPYGKCLQDGDEGCVSPETIAALEQWIMSGAPK